jgi:hypothetical protein
MSMRINGTIEFGHDKKSMSHTILTRLVRVNGGKLIRAREYHMKHSILSGPVWVMVCEPTLGQEKKACHIPRPDMATLSNDYESMTHKCYRHGDIFEGLNWLHCH